MLALSLANNGVLFLHVLTVEGVAVVLMVGMMRAAASVELGSFTEGLGGVTVRFVSNIHIWR